MPQSGRGTDLTMLNGSLKPQLTQKVEVMNCVVDGGVGRGLLFPETLSEFQK